MGIASHHEGETRGQDNYTSRPGNIMNLPRRESHQNSKTWRQAATAHLIDALRQVEDASIQPRAVHLHR